MGKERETTAGSLGVGLRGSGQMAASWRGRCWCRTARRGSGQGRARRGSGRRSVQRVGSRRLRGAQSWRCLARSLASRSGTGRGREMLLGRVCDGVRGGVAAQWPGVRDESRAKRGERQTTAQPSLPFVYGSKGRAVLGRECCGRESIQEHSVLWRGVRACGAEGSGEGAKETGAAGREGAAGGTGWSGGRAGAGDWTERGEKGNGMEGEGGAAGGTRASRPNPLST